MLPKRPPSLPAPGNHADEPLPRQPAGRTGLLSLRTVLIVPFVLQLIAAVGLIGWLSFRNGQQAVHDLSAQLRSELIARIQQQIQTYVEIPYSINSLNASAFSRGELDVATAKGVHQLWQQAKIFPATNLIYCAEEQNGELVGVGRSPGQRNPELLLYSRATGRLGYYYSLDARGDVVQLARRGEKTYDARVRPWYKAAKSKGGAVWSNIYLDFDTQLPTITASVPAYSETHQLIGVCATDFLLPIELSKFLRTLDINGAGETFIVEPAGILVSSSSNESLTVGFGDNRKLRQALESNNPLVRKTTLHLIQQFGNLKAIQTPQQLDVQINGDRHFVQVRPFDDGRGLKWLIVVVVPESNFMAQIDANTRTTILLSSVATLLAIAIGVLTTRRITRPIMDVSQASQRMASGNLDQHVEAQGIRELETLSSSFNSMAAQLQESFTALAAKEATNRALIAAIPDLLIRAKSDGTHLDITELYRFADRADRPRFNIASTADIAIYEALPTLLAEKRMDAVRQALQTGNLQVYEHSLLVQGESREEEVRIAVIGPDEVLIMIRDITERKQSEVALRIAEENYRSIFENALNGIFQSTADGHFVSVNPAMARIFGYSSPEEMMINITEIKTQLYVHPERRDAFLQQMAQQGEVKDFEFQAYRKDGQTIWVQQNTRVVRNTQNQIIYFEGIIEDITERKQLEAELKRQLEELRIEIDQQKRKKQVIEITKSDYFQEIQAEIEQFQIDEFWK